MADAYLPHAVTFVPTSWVIADNGQIYPKVRHYVKQGVVRVVAGATECHVVVDIQRPYVRPRSVRAVDYQAERGE